MSLFWRMFLSNAIVLVIATGLLIGPWVTVSSPVLAHEALVLCGGLIAMLVANGLLFRIGLAPLKRLTKAMADANLLEPGQRARVTGRGELAELTESFNVMLGRLESERAESSGRVLSAQESERRRVARELHDEVGQTLTAVILQFKGIADRVPTTLREEVVTAQETVRGSLDEVRRIARRLRPGVLEDLGLPSALRALVTEFSAPGVTTSHRVDGSLTALGAEAELVLYRVAQEAMTNAARHSGASRIGLELRTAGGRAVELTVSDNGTGFRHAAKGAGLQGMRERALLLGAALTLTSLDSGGTTVRLRVPLPTEGAT
ncbi:MULTISPECIES: HAMP domain-containing sensor histidine kinase [unclassified Streptomyces]|uniref:HAMP domain-containing sensor histidine kinase n=1 Tax=unclassified Streptomyces TaxID=2593676 RepID=UPI002E123B2A|nr:sensor histidine kinase [Streptomyces sp. NBC_01320]